MRRIILLISLLLLSASWMFAQYGGQYGQYGEGQYGQRNEGMHRLRVEGCLYGEPGDLVLLDDQGNTFQLVGRRTDRLNDFVGHRVRVEGRSWFNPDNPYAMGANEENGPTLHVFDIEHISPYRCGEREHEHERENNGTHIEIPIP